MTQAYLSLIYNQAMRDYSNNKRDSMQSHACIPTNSRAHFGLRNRLCDGSCWCQQRQAGNSKDDHWLKVHSADEGDGVFDLIVRGKKLCGSLYVYEGLQPHIYIHKHGALRPPVSAQCPQGAGRNQAHHTTPFLWTFPDLQTSL